MKQLLILLISATLLAACKGTKTSVTEDKSATPTIVGNDADEHGCKASAGYTYSILKNDCIRVWETGIQLTQIDNNEGNKSNATIIISDDKLKVELFIAAENNKSIMLIQSTNQLSTYKAKDYLLSNTNNIWILKKGEKEIFKN